MILASKAKTRNAKVAAITLAIAAFLILVLSHFDESLAPLRLFSIMLAAFATWALSDEMGIHKPLNRAGMVLFSVALIAKIQLTLGVAAQVEGRYYLMYAACLLFSVFFWSIAFLHRNRELKVVGAVGVLAALLPIVFIIVGHVALGFGAVLGVDALLNATSGGQIQGTAFVTTVERIFGLWAYVAAWMLWRGYINEEHNVKPLASV